MLSAKEIKERFYKSKTGKALWEAYVKTNGFELTDEFKEKAIKRGIPLDCRQTAQYIGGTRNIILMDREYTTSDLFIATIMHETAHAYQKFFLGMPMCEDEHSRVDAIGNEGVYAAVIESDAWARGLVAFIKSEPTAEEVKAFQGTKGVLLKQIGFFDIPKKKDLDERDMSREIFKKMYTFLLPNQFNEKALQPFLDSALNDKVYSNKEKEFSEELKRQEMSRLLAVLKVADIKKNRK